MKMIYYIYKMSKCRKCGKYASFGLPNQKAEYCASHKLFGMINVYSRRCTFPGCNKLAYYTLPGIKLLYHCYNHRLPEMVSIVNKKCVYVGCDKYSSFGLPGKKSQFCAKHKLPEMINVRHKLNRLNAKIEKYKNNQEYYVIEPSFSE